MLTAVRPILRPLPLLGLSTGGLFLAATLSSTFRSAKMSTSNSTRWHQYKPCHASWPYNPSDFKRHDESVDTEFYISPRFVTHIGDAAIASLREYYNSALPKTGRILDFCPSWVSLYPPSIEQAATQGELMVTGLGMSKPELDVNKVLNNGRIINDLNNDPDIAKVLQEAKAIGSTDELLDVSTNVVSTDYLTKPVEVLKSLLTVTKPGGTVHLTMSTAASRSKPSAAGCG
jgi:hypothetical protein